MQGDSRDFDMNVWWNVALVALTWVVSAAVNWGVFSEKLKSLDSRMRRLEANDERYVTRIEYEGRHRDLKELITSLHRSGRQSI